MRFSPARFSLGLLLVLLFATPLAAQEREEIVRVPATGGASLIATVLRPLFERGALFLDQRADAISIVGLVGEHDHVRP